MKRGGTSIRELGDEGGGISANAMLVQAVLAFQLTGLAERVRRQRPHVEVRKLLKECTRQGLRYEVGGRMTRPCGQSTHSYNQYNAGSAYWLNEPRVQ